LLRVNSKKLVNIPIRRYLRQPAACVRSASVVSTIAVSTSSSAAVAFVSCYARGFPATDTEANAQITTPTQESRQSYLPEDIPRHYSPTLRAVASTGTQQTRSSRPLSHEENSHPSQNTKWMFTHFQTKCYRIQLCRRVLVTALLVVTVLIRRRAGPVLPFRVNRATSRDCSSLGPASRPRSTTREFL